ncbi:MAG: hypothetical protein Hyperionvirus5_21 [Hyperionvirus sp.]|uniref:Uncharacterized protein n=1 Tax=Hyperionvirus sp. TaxID=2487770 RepID=A0A3G5A7K7_9VIRU|nr:MAG: hypothetical protein Hyperionvirus5_21 [Hyperionvirus sp.]
MQHGPRLRILAGCVCIQIEEIQLRNFEHRVHQPKDWHLGGIGAFVTPFGLKAKPAHIQLVLVLLVIETDQRGIYDSAISLLGIFTKEVPCHSHHLGHLNKKFMFSNLIEREIVDHLRVRMKEAANKNRIVKDPSKTREFQFFCHIRKS